MPRSIRFYHVLCLFVFFFSFLLYQKTLLPTVGFWDTAEFQTIPFTLDVGHPTGFPTFILERGLKTRILPLFFFVLGTSVYLFLPVRASQKQPLTFAYDVSTLQGFIRHVTAADFRGLMFSNAKNISQKFAFFSNLLLMLSRRPKISRDINYERKGRCTKF